MDAIFGDKIDFQVVILYKCWTSSYRVMGLPYSPLPPGLGKDSQQIDENPASIWAWAGLAQFFFQYSILSCVITTTTWMKGKTGHDALHPLSRRCCTTAYELSTSP